MIKVDVISGFLGAGKTTLIMHLAKALYNSGERLAIIENEFGEKSIDGKVLNLNGLEVFEINQGCLCCTLKGDFTATLLKIAVELNPERIIIEPSGIFILSEIYNLFNTPEIKKIMMINSVTTIVDSDKFIKQRKRYNYFFENQIQYTKKVVLSKTSSVSEESIVATIDEIMRINPAVEVFAKDWSIMSDAEFASLLKTADDIPFDSGCFEKNSVPAPSHRSFSSFAISPKKTFTVESLKDILQRFSTENPNILRIKGFVSTSTTSLLNFNYVQGTVEINMLSQEVNLEPLVCFIGEDMDKHDILKAFM
jgi:G3E family GTPase